MSWVRRLIYLICFVLVIIFTLWLVVQVSEDNIHRITADANLPDAYVNGLILTQMGDTGQVASRFYAKKAVHYATDVTLLDTPYAILYGGNDDANNLTNTLSAGAEQPATTTSKKSTKKQQPPWMIKADHGRLTQSGTVLYLWDNVRIWQAKGQQNQSTVFTTTSLTYYPKTRLAKTKAPVNIDRGDGSKISAVGMKANLNTGEITFLSKTRGRYVLQP